jgi:hypothetical protein
MGIGAKAMRVSAEQDIFCQFNKDGETVAPDLRDLSGCGSQCGSELRARLWLTVGSDQHHVISEGAVSIGCHGGAQRRPRPRYLHT